MTISDTKKIQIHLDDQCRLFVDPVMTKKGKREYNGWGQLHVATLDDTDLFDLFSFLKMRLMEKHQWGFIEKMLSKEILDVEKEIYKKYFKQSEGNNGRLC